tara:strand:+ start:307 stop:474 length:168 start_codon:yes stop_codon:yes gene_type:complete
MSSRRGWDDKDFKDYIEVHGTSLDKQIHSLATEEPDNREDPNQDIDYHWRYSRNH